MQNALGGLYPNGLNCQRLRSGLHLKVLFFLCCCLDVKQTTIRCLSSSAIDAPRLLDSINWDSVLTSKSWTTRYHFRARLRLPPTRLLQICQSASRLVWQIFLRRTLGGFEHRFGHKLEIKLKSQHRICYASGDNNHLLHLCHCWSRTTRKGRVYKNATKYENSTNAQPLMSQLPIV